MVPSAHRHAAASDDPLVQFLGATAYPILQIRPSTTAGGGLWNVTRVASSRPSCGFIALQTLHLYNLGIQVQGAKALGRIFNANDTLERVILTGIDDEHVDDIMRGIATSKSLKKVEFCFCQLKATGIRRIVNGLVPRKQSMELQFDNCLGVAAGIALLKDIFQGQAGVTKLTLHNCGLDSESAAKLAKVLIPTSDACRCSADSSSAVRPLEELDITSNPAMCGSGCMEIFRAMKQNNHVRRLNLSGIRAGDVALMKGLGDMLTVNTVLQHLRLDFIGTLSGLESLARGIVSNRSLLQLDLKGQYDTSLREVEVIQAKIDGCLRANRILAKYSPSTDPRHLLPEIYSSVAGHPAACYALLLSTDMERVLP